MNYEPTYTLVDDRVIETLEGVLESIRRTLSGVDPTDSATAARLGIVQGELDRLWTIGALAAKHAVHILPRDLTQEQRDAACSYFEHYLGPQVRNDNPNP